jgi:hypothetical protein
LQYGPIGKEDGRAVFAVTADTQAKIFIAPDKIATDTIVAASHALKARGTCGPCSADGPSSPRSALKVNRRPSAVGARLELVIDHDIVESASSRDRTGWQIRARID